jgi:hypothetical protein
MGPRRELIRAWPPVSVAGRAASRGG